MKSYHWVLLILLINSCSTISNRSESETQPKKESQNTEMTELTTARDFQSEFLKYWEDEDTTKQFETLKEWEKQSPNDPELYTFYFNYHFMQSQKEGLELTTQEPSGDALIIQDSLGNSEGYLTSRIIYDLSEFSKAMEYIETGINKFPDRLDMRFGKTYALGQLENWDDFTKEIIRTIDHSSTNNTWLWSNNEEREGGNDFMLSAIQDYQVKLYETGTNSLLTNMREISNRTLKYYPEHVESLSNLAITYTLTEEYKKGLEALLKAEKIAPTDHVVLDNIANSYELLENKKMAIKYYEKMIAHGEEHIIQFAKNQIELLKKE